MEIDFLPGYQAAQILAKSKNSRQRLPAVFASYLPGKTAPVLLEHCNTPLCNATRAQLHAAAETLHHFRFIPSGTSGYTKAEATAGGVDTRELNPSTLEARRVPGLFITGELADVTGNLGGFNLHWAWASAFLAAQTLQKRT